MIEIGEQVSVEPPCSICGDEKCDGSCDHGPDEMSDVEADADTLKSAGLGTDEDYAPWEEWQGDSDGSVGCD